METIEELRDFLSKSLPEARIYLFGSRARGDHTVYSDIDIAIEDSSATLSKRLPLIRFRIEESKIPYKVDLIDLSKASYLKKIVHKEGIRWQ